MTTINGKKPQESGPSGAPAKKPLPFKRGVRRGDVLLMVAKLDPESAKPEQRTPSHDAPTCKTPAPVTDPGGGKKGETPPIPKGPQTSTEDAAPKAEKTQTGGLGDPETVLLTKDEKDQGTAKKGGEAPQTKGLKGDETQGKEGPGEGRRPGTVEKGEGNPPNKVAKGNLSKDAMGEGKLAGAQIQVKKWGSSLGGRSRWAGPQRKDKEGKAEKTDKLQIKAEKVDKAQGKVGEAPRVMEKTRGPHRESGGAGEAGSETEKGCEAPKEVRPAGKESQPDSRGQKAEEPCGSVHGRAEALETELEGPQVPALESRAERPQMQENQEGPALQEGSKGSQSGDLDQVRGRSPGVGTVGRTFQTRRDGKDLPLEVNKVGSGDGQGIGKGWPARRKGQALPP